MPEETSASTLRYTQKDIQYLKQQDAALYRTHYPSLIVRFVDPDGTPVNSFGSQDKVAYHEPVELPVLVRFDDLNKVQDRYNLEEVPEAWAVFSSAILEETGFPVERVTVEPDVIIKDFAEIDWRITKVFKQDFLGHVNNEFLHYECILERNTRVNLDLPEVKENLNFWFGCGDEALTFCDDIQEFDLTNDNTDPIVYDCDTEFVYFAYPQELGVLVSILDETATEVIGDFTLRTESVEGEVYNIYESNSAFSVQKTFTFKLTI